MAAGVIAGEPGVVGATAGEAGAAGVIAGEPGVTGGTPGVPVQAAKLCHARLRRVSTI